MCLQDQGPFLESTPGFRESTSGRGGYMRKALVFGLMGAALLARADGGAMSNSERAYLMEQLEQSKKAMLASIDGLTEAQWKFKPAPAVWSVQECAEHIVLAEGYIFEGAQQVLKTPAVERSEKSNSSVDQVL